jgi:glycosyltransferase involved in cell wall biosynthesis
MVSILMPIYNGIEYLPESLNTVMQQDMDAWELLIGINGYEKNSEVYKTAINYSSEKVRVYDFSELKGKSVTLNALLKKAKHDIICLLDVDDLWLSNKLSAQINYKDKYDVIGTHCQYFEGSDARPWLHVGELLEEHFRDINSIINSSSMIVRRGRDIYWDASWDGVEDYDLWIRLVKQGFTFFNIDSGLVRHRIHKNSFYNTKNNAMSDELKKQRFNI